MVTLHGKKETPRANPERTRRIKTMRRGNTAKETEMAEGVIGEGTLSRWPKRAEKYP